MKRRAGGRALFDGRGRIGAEDPIIGALDRRVLLDCSKLRSRSFDFVCYCVDVRFRVCAFVRVLMYDLLCKCVCVFTSMYVYVYVFICARIRPFYSFSRGLAHMTAPTPRPPQ